MTRLTRVGHDAALTMSPQIQPTAQRHAYPVGAVRDEASTTSSLAETNLGGARMPILRRGGPCCLGAVLSVFTFAYAQDGPDGHWRSEGEEVMAQWLEHAGPCFELEAEVMFIRSGPLLSGE